MGRSIRQFDGVRARRRADNLSSHVVRIGWLLLTLLYDRVASYEMYRDRFGLSLREFQRDLRKIREIGKGRFHIPRTKSGRAFLYEPGKRALSRVVASDRDVTETLTRIAESIGGPIERELREVVEGVACDFGRDAFLQLREPLPSANDRVVEVFDQLRAAARDSARVEFLYKPARGPRASRRVEPYHVIARSGRYYLVAYDLIRYDWRLFALDAVEGPIRRAGTFNTRRVVPVRYLAERAVGWISGPRSVDVTIRFAPSVAAAVTSRTWQDGQRIAVLPDGGAELTLAFDDLGEAVRWSLGFAPNAVIVAPPDAVVLARDTIEYVASAYGHVPIGKMAG
jgi:predicted DNA-binding transcriptional regulator YafY